VNAVKSFYLLPSFTPGFLSKRYTFFKVYPISIHHLDEIDAAFDGGSLTLMTKSGIQGKLIMMKKNTCMNTRALSAFPSLCLNPNPNCGIDCHECRKSSNEKV
jgi:hypothetical protein